MQGIDTYRFQTNSHLGLRGEALEQIFYKGGSSPNPKGSSSSSRVTFLAGRASSNVSNLRLGARCLLFFNVVVVGYLLFPERDTDASFAFFAARYSSLSKGLFGTLALRRTGLPFLFIFFSGSGVDTALVLLLLEEEDGIAVPERLLLLRGVVAPRRSTDLGIKIGRDSCALFG